MAERLAAAADLTGGAIRWDESTGMRQVYAHDLHATVTLDMLRSMYRRTLHGARGMTTLADKVRVNRRFQRSIRVDTDIDEPSALEGFVCPSSTAQALLSMARQVVETCQGAFTWTGPYGSGKSSLAVALAALLGHDGRARVRKPARRLVRRLRGSCSRF